MPFIFEKGPLSGIIIIKPRLFEDNRGFFRETYKWSSFSSNGISEKFLQDNHSRSTEGVLRGLHYQIHPKAQGKLVGVIKGRIWDVALDIRVESPTFKQWCHFDLSSENNVMVYLPQGFAHGFLTLSEEAHVIYKCTEEYDKNLERGIKWNDKEIAIEWPIKIPILSKKDSQLPNLKETDLV